MELLQESASQRGRVRPRDKFLRLVSTGRPDTVFTFTSPTRGGAPRALHSPRGPGSSPTRSQALPSPSGPGC
eukprot:6624120-Prymnesium_polylepis.1